MKKSIMLRICGLTFGIVAAILLFSCSSEETTYIPGPSPTMFAIDKPLKENSDAEHNGLFYVAIPPYVTEMELMLAPTGEGWRSPIPPSEATGFFRDFYYNFNFSTLCIKDCTSDEFDYTFVESPYEGEYWQVRPNDIKEIPVRIDNDNWVCEQTGLEMHREVRDGYVYLKLKFDEMPRDAQRSQKIHLFFDYDYWHCNEPHCIYCWGREHQTGIVIDRINIESWLKYYSDDNYYLEKYGAAPEGYFSQE